MKLKWLGTTPEQTLQNLGRQNLVEIRSRIRFKSGVLPGEISIGTVSRPLRHALRLASKVHKLALWYQKVERGAKRNFRRRFHRTFLKLSTMYAFMMEAICVGLKKTFCLADDVVFSLRSGYHIVCRKMDGADLLFARSLA